MRKAFTLIEMLVVISLIGILAAIALISFGSVQKSARDTTRRSDLKQYQTAIESYANKLNGLFPEYNAVRSASINLCGSLNTQFEPDIICPEDPKSTTNGVYSYISDGSGVSGSASATKYVLWAKLENKTPTTYWFVCSNGRNGESTSTPSVAGCSI